MVSSSRSLGVLSAGFCISPEGSDMGSLLGKHKLQTRTAASRDATNGQLIFSFLRRTRGIKQPDYKAPALQPSCSPL